MKRPATALIVGGVVLLCLIWGTTWKAIQIGLDGIPPFTGAALRFGLASILMLTLALRLKVPLGRSRRERRLWLINGACSFTISYGVVYWAEQWVPSGLASILFATYPFFVALLGHFLLPSESMTRKEVVGILIGFAGIGAIFSEDFNVLGGPQVALASAVLLVSPLAAALGSVSVKRWGSGIHPLSFSSVPMGVAAGMLGALALVFEGDRSVRFDTVSVGVLLYLAIFGSAVTFGIYYWLLAHLAVKRLALIAYVIPVVAVLLGVALGEPLTTHILVGSALVIVGVALAVERTTH
jgi:drug/metabolite transporter (DMT)-like permease